MDDSCGKKRKDYTRTRQACGITPAEKAKKPLKRWVFCVEKSKKGLETQANPGRKYAPISPGIPDGIGEVSLYTITTLVQTLPLEMER
jgi:hypothetical protein